MIEKKVTLASTCLCDIVKQVLSSMLLAIRASNISKYIAPRAIHFFTRYKMPFDYHDGLEKSCLELYFCETFLSWVAYDQNISEDEIARLSSSLVLLPLRLPTRWTAIRERCKTNLFCWAEKVLESIPHLCYEKVSAPASTLDSAVLENSLSTSVEATLR